MSLNLSSRKIKVISIVICVPICALLVWFVLKVASVEGEMGIDERIARAFGWGISDSVEGEVPEPYSISSEVNESDDEQTKPDERDELIASLSPVTYAVTDNCTVNYGNLMLINPNWMVEDSFIAARRNELVSLNATYGITELNAYNGDNLMDAEAAEHLNEMLTAYKADFPGQEMQTVSCYREVGTNCGRLCMPTGASDHHTGLACDLVDAAYGTSLDTSTYEAHPDWQWLRKNSYKYGFIDRFPEEWAGGPMSEPMNVDENGSTGLFETWHYRYVGVDFATDIATGKYNDGKYDSLEHYLKARGLVTDLKTGKCAEKDV